MNRYSLSSISTERSSTKYDDLNNLNQKCSSENILFEAGDILVTCRPFIHIIADSWRGKICDLCLRISANNRLNICKDCKQIYYCTSCQQLRSPSIFKNVHNLECGILSKYGHILSSSSRLLLRLYLRLFNQESIHYQPILNPLTKEPITFDQLEPPIVCECNELVERIKMCYEKYNGTDIDLKSTINMSAEEMALLQFTELLDDLRLCRDNDLISSMIIDDVRVYELWNIFTRLWSYAVPIFDETLSGLFSKDAIAYGLFLEPSIMLTGSHSCIPNCSFVHYGPVIQLRSMKSIDSDEPLTINLVDISLPRPERMKQLRHYYINDCDCLRCIEQLQNDGHDMIDLDLFHKLRNEFIELYENELVNESCKKNKSFLESTFSNDDDEDEIAKWEQKCLKMSELAHRLYELYEKLYLFEHPEKSKFLFAFMSVEMNFLLFRLEFRQHHQSQNGTTNFNCQSIVNGSSKKYGRKSGSLTTLDSIILDIENWSNLLKRTVKSIRITHGIDHRLYREYRIPIINLWKKILPKSPLTLQQLYQDPGILIKSSSSSIMTNSYKENFLAQLINDKLTTKQEQHCRNESIKLQSTAINNGRNICYKIIIRLILVIFAILFPFFIYFTLFLQTSDF